MADQSEEALCAIHRFVGRIRAGKVPDDSDSTHVIEGLQAAIDQIRNNKLHGKDSNPTRAKILLKSLGLNRGMGKPPNDELDPGLFHGQMRPALAGMVLEEIESTGCSQEAAIAKIAEEGFYRDEPLSEDKVRKAFEDHRKDAERLRELRNIPKTV